MNNDYTHIAIVLDKSGSMGSVLTDTIRGVNTFVEDQKKAPGTACVTLATFSDYVTFAQDGPISSFAPLSTASYRPCGNTALYDAIGGTIHHLGSKFENMAEKDRPATVVVAIITDGYENVSREYNSKTVADMIEHQQSKYSWEFVYIGANQDAVLAAKTIGIGASNALNYAANAGGTKALYRSLSANLSSYRGGVGQTMAFSDDDRKTQIANGASV